MTQEEEKKSKKSQDQIALVTQKAEGSERAPEECRKDQIRASDAENEEKESIQSRASDARRRLQESALRSSELRQ